METFCGTKIIKARPMTLGEYNQYREWELPPNEDPMTPGYLVEYVGEGKPNHPKHTGYISWSPTDVFERSYHTITGMSFGQAIEALKQGKCVCRKGWNGKGMFLWLKPAVMIQESWCKDPLLKKLCALNGGEIQALGTICMYTHDSTGRQAILTGWLASQSDMLLDDWEITEPF